MDSVRSWVVGVARSVICGYLYPKMVGLWGRIAGVRIFDTRLRRVRRWSGSSCWRCTVNGARGARALATRGSSQLYCNGVQWVTFKFNLKF